MSRWRNGAILSLVIVLSITYFPFSAVRFHDYRAFYCAGTAVLQRADPYREHPLHDCERSASAPGVSLSADDVTVPAPLPGYLIAVFAGLAVLPFWLSVQLWVAASIGALALSIKLLQRIIDVPLAPIAIILGFPALLVAVPLGQTTPFVGFGLVLCAYGLHRHRARLAAVGALITAIDPAVALAVCLSLVIFVPRARLVVLLGTGTLIAVSLLVLGRAEFIEYVLAVLPAHALSSVTESTQYSTTHIAWIFGAPPAAAIGIGKIWYTAALIGGIWAGRRLCNRFGVAALALVPAAASVFGGLYVHYQQLVLALPAFTLLASRAPNRRMTALLKCAIFVAALPWLSLAAFPPFALALIVIALAFADDLQIRPYGRQLAIGCATFECAAFVGALLGVHHHGDTFHYRAVGNPLAEATWQRYIAWSDARPHVLVIALQFPTVTAMMICGYETVRLASRRDFISHNKPRIAPSTTEST